MNEYALATQDLATYNNDDIDVLARYYGVSGNRKEILWSLAYKIHEPQALLPAGKPPKDIHPINLDLP